MGDGGLDNMVVTDIYFDNVVLPKLYGEGELPLAITTPNRYRYFSYNKE